MTPLSWIVVLLYGLSALVFARSWGRRAIEKSTNRDRWIDRVRIGWIVLGIGLACHTAEIAHACLQGKNPSSGVAEAVSFLAWLVGLLFFVVSWRAIYLQLGAWIVPVQTGLFLVAHLVPDRAEGFVGQGGGAMLAIHVTCATLGVALFAVAAGSAAVYLWLDRGLRLHRRGSLAWGGAAVETLDLLNRRCVEIGFPVFSVALLTGVWWAGLGSHRSWIISRLAIAVIAWTIFGLLLLARYWRGLRGRRSAIGTLLGFALTLLVIGGYLLRDVIGGGA